MRVSSAKKVEYQKLLHAMQSGVKVTMELNRHTDNSIEMGEVSPKHLRCGVNSAMCEHAALTELLIEKGIIGEDEYFNKIIKQLEIEVKNYEDILSKKTGQKVKLE